jgi:hypothetical protein
MCNWNAQNDKQLNYVLCCEFSQPRYAHIFCHSLKIHTNINQCSMFQLILSDGRLNFMFYMATEKTVLLETAEVGQNNLIWVKPSTKLLTSKK